MLYKAIRWIRLAVAQLGPPKGHPIQDITIQGFVCVCDNCQGPHKNGPHINDDEDYNSHRLKGARVTFRCL